MGHFEIAGVDKDRHLGEGGVSSQQVRSQTSGKFCWHFATGRIAVLSDQQGEEWMHDYRFLEACDENPAADSRLTKC